MNVKFVQNILHFGQFGVLGLVTAFIFSDLSLASNLPETLLAGHFDQSRGVRFDKWDTK